MASRSSASTRACSKYDLPKLGRRARPLGRPRVRLPRHPDPLRPLPDRRQDHQARPAASRRRSSSGCASPWVFSSTSKATAKLAPPRSTTSTRARRFCSSHAHAFQLRHAPFAALVLLPLLCATIPSRASSRPRHRRKRLPLEMGGRPRRLVDRVRGTGAHIGGTNGESPGRHSVPQAPQRPARRRQPGRQAPAAPAAPTSRPGTTTSTTSSSCARTPATTAAAPTT